jgi:hypothetical protein
MERRRVCQPRPHPQPRQDPRAPQPRPLPGPPSPRLDGFYPAEAI